MLRSGRGSPFVFSQPGARHKRSPSRRTELRASWVRIPLLLIFAALAFAGAADDTHAWQTSRAVGASVPAGFPGHQDQIDVVSAPEQPPLLAGARVSGLSIGSRALGGGPPAGQLRHLALSSASGLVLLYSLTAVCLLIAARSRLGFAHDGAMARAGAHSSFGTSLPPPLLA